MAHKTQLTAPPQGWSAMLELLAVRPAATPPPERGGFLARLFRGPLAHARERGEADLGRLGLATTQHAEERHNATSRIPDMVGPTIVRGERLGRAVEIRIDADRYRTKLDVPVAELHVRSEDGLLRASERSPAELHAALDGLPRDERWKGVEVKGGNDGVTVFHKLGSRGGGTQGYLDDLWLAEGIAGLLGAP